MSHRRNPRLDAASLQVLLPVRPQPIPEEVFSSWITRVAVDNGHLPRVLVARMLNPRIVRSGVDADAWLGLDEVCRLEEAVAVQRAEVLQSFLWTFEGVVAPTFSRQKPIPWIAELGRRPAIANGYAYCAACLANDGTPYIRKRWRLAFHTICPRHRRVLDQRCPACGCAVMLLRHVDGNGTKKLPCIASCQACGFDLRRSADRGTGASAGAEFDNLVALCTNFDAQPLQIGGESLPYPFQVLAGLRAIAGVLIAPRGATLAAEISKRSGLNVVAAQSGQHRPPFEREPVVLRHQTMMAVLWLVEDWPERFLAVARASGTSRWTFATDRREELPHWLSSVIRVELDGRRYSPSAMEAASAYRVAIAQQARDSKIAVKQLLGVTEGKAVDHLVSMWDPLESTCRHASLSIL